MDEDATWYGSRPRPSTRGGPSSRERGTAAPLFSAHVYCDHGRPSQLLLSSCERRSDRGFFEVMKPLSIIFQKSILHLCGCFLHLFQNVYISSDKICTGNLEYNILHYALLKVLARIMACSRLYVVDGKGSTYSQLTYHVRPHQQIIDQQGIGLRGLIQKEAHLVIPDLH